MGINNGIQFADETNEIYEKQKSALGDISSDESELFMRKKTPTIIKPNKDAMQQLRNTTGGLNDSQMKTIQENVLLDSLKKQNKTKYFDISLSGTSATIVIQLPRKLIVGWVGDSKVAI